MHMHNTPSAYFLALGVGVVSVGLGFLPVNGLLACALVALGLSISAVSGYRLLRLKKAPSPDEWRAQEASFRGMKTEIEGMWSRRDRTRAVNWHIAQKHNATKRDLQHFQDEAKCASQLLMRSLGYDRKRFWAAFGLNPVDQWLNALMMLQIDPASDMRHSSGGGGWVSQEGASVDRLVEMSAIACARLAAGGRPTPSSFPIRDFGV